MRWRRTPSNSRQGRHDRFSSFLIGTDFGEAGILGRPLPACPAGEAVLWLAAVAVLLPPSSQRTSSPAGQAGRGRPRRAAPPNPYRSASFRVIQAGLAAKLLRSAEEEGTRMFGWFRHVRGVDPTRSSDVVTVARAEATARGDECVDTGHLLLALCRLTDRPGWRAIAACGFLPEQVRAAVLRMQSPGLQWVNPGDILL